MLTNQAQTLCSLTKHKPYVCLHKCKPCVNLPIAYPVFTYQSIDTAFNYQVQTVCLPSTDHVLHKPCVKLLSANTVLTYQAQTLS